ncbi:MAG: right-handed parallel beta-helix repeat-containing protein [Deltaproteobacteria bacterium]|nr:right-handed parallel beta-helix repeat-containing protein [Deltaproteobacteria bacterium]
MNLTPARAAILAAAAIASACGPAGIEVNEPTADSIDAGTAADLLLRRRGTCSVSPDPATVDIEAMVLGLGLASDEPIRVEISVAGSTESHDAATDSDGGILLAFVPRAAGSGRVSIYGGRRLSKLAAVCSFLVEAAAPQPDDAGQDAAVPDADAPDAAAPDIDAPDTAAPTCGDGDCSGGETCVSCARDCGECPATGTEYYVAANGGSDSYDGRSAAFQGGSSGPWQTIRHAVSTVTAGATVYVRAGTYHETIDPVRSGSADNWIAFRNYPGEQPLIDGQNGTRQYCIRVNGYDHLLFSGFRLTGVGNGSSGSSAVAVLPGSDSIVLDNLEVYGNRIGIRLNGSSSSAGAAITNVVIRNCQLHDNTKYGLFIYRKCQHIVVGPGNSISFNGITQVEDHPFGIEIGAAYGTTTTSPDPVDTWPTQIEVVGNEIYSNEEQGVRPGFSRKIWIHDNYIHDNGATGIQAEHNVENIVVEDNVLEHNALWHEYETGLWFSNVVNGCARRNVIRANTLGLTTQYGRDLIIHHNLFLKNDRGVASDGSFTNPGASYGGSTSGINMWGGTSYCYMTHNTLYQNTSPDSGSASLRIKNNGNDHSVFKNNIVAMTQADVDLVIDAADHFSSDNNGFFNSRDTRVRWLGSELSLAAYRSASGQDAHSLTGDPKFVSAIASGGDFSLQAGSPAIDAGALLTSVTSAAGQGTTFAVADARYFCPGWDTGAAGDTIAVGDNPPVRLVSVDNAASTLTVDTAVTWQSGDAVSFAYAGAGPDLGAFERAQ